MGRTTTSETVLYAMRGDTVRHGLELMRDTGLSSGALYPALVRLERTGLVESRWTPAGRRCYLLTPDGVTAIGTGTASRADPSIAAWWLAVLAIAAVEATAALYRPTDRRLSDLGVYMGSVSGWRHGASLYDYMSASHAPFTYPPFAGVVFWPLSFIPTVPLQFGWACGTVAIVVALSVLLARTADRPWRHRTPAIAAVLLVSAPVTSNLRFGQVSIGLAALVALDVLALGRRRYHGVLIGVAAAVKLTPLIFIPMLWFAGRRWAAVVATGTFTTCGVLAWAALPADSWRFWGTEMWHVSRLGHITSVGNQSLNGVVMRLGIEGPIRSPLVLLVAGSVAAVALRRAARLGRDGDWLSAMTVVGAASIVLSPVSWTHHQVWSVLGAMLPVRGPAWVRRLFRTGLLAVMILPVTALGPPLWSNARMLAAVAIACVVPVRGVTSRFARCTVDATHTPAGPGATGTQPD